MYVGEKSTLLRTAEEAFLVGLERHSPLADLLIGVVEV